MAKCLVRAGPVNRAVVTLTSAIEETAGGREKHVRSGEIITTRLPLRGPQPALHNLIGTL